MPAPERKVVPLQKERRRKETYRYASLVLEAWDRMEHESKRERLEQAAEVRRKARNTL
ncbi:hypothetical protein GCM10009078_51440 [Cupriavidus gilardii]